MCNKLIRAIMSLTAMLQVGAVVAQDVSANIGWNSEYLYRGIPQKTSSAFGGFDYAAQGFNLGVWAANVGDGAEIDYYGGYSFDVGDFGFFIGGTWYTYTSLFDDKYLELNLGANWKWISFNMATGQYDNFGRPKLEYQFYSLTASHNGFYATFGFFEEDFAGEYYEAGYGNSLDSKDTELFDYGFAVVYSNATLLGGKSDTNLVLTLSKTFSF